MEADRIATLTPTIAEVFSASTTEIWCATFTVSGDGERWIQVMREQLNFAYPHQRDPEALVAECGLPSWATLSLTEWEAKNFAAFEFPAGLQPSDVARIVDTLLVAVIGAPPDYTVEAELFQIPP